ncbi:peptidoglycan-binding domain-containing protein [Streptomyces sp. NPDC096310]|uniref:peptidoglycan-binding domain-containing protein n=1 Tax=Streptomyces sp. NPDC096310 TaxID=3366082 RepID=UPI0037F10F43
MTEPSDPTRPGRRTVLEPTHVIRRRRPRALSDFTELFRPEDTGTDDPEDGRGEGWENVPLGAKPSGPTKPPSSPKPSDSWDFRRGHTASDSSQDTTDTEELPPVPAPSGETGWNTTTGRSARFTAFLGVAGAGVVGFGVALLLTWGGSEGTSEAAEPPASSPFPSPTAPPTTAPAPGTPPTAAPADPGGAAPVLQEGDSGPEVSDLQERLSRIPNVYEGGSVSGTYDTVLTEAVGRFQLWYGIRGDETGVYGDDTRRDLESRTGS